MNMPAKISSARFSRMGGAASIPCDRLLAGGTTHLICEHVSSRLRAPRISIIGLPMSPHFLKTLTEAMREVIAGYAEFGLDVTVYELGTALEEALSDEESWTGWLNRMEAFVRASVTPKA
jgi:hypothetical protein